MGDDADYEREIEEMDWLNPYGGSSQREPDPWWRRAIWWLRTRWRRLIERE